MGNIYYSLQQYSEAIAAYKECIARKSDNAGPYYNMGSAYKKLKQYQEAIAAFKKAIALEPTGKLADKARKSISEIDNRDKP